MSEPQEPYGHTYEDEVSLLDFLVSVKKSALFLWHRRFLLSICFFLAFGFLGLKQYLSPVEYKAALTFMLSDDLNNQVGSVSSILGQIGLPISSGRYNIDKLVEIAKSRSIIELVLFEEILLGGKTDFIANHIIRLYDINAQWADRFGIIEFTHSNIDSFSLAENYALLTLHKKIVGNKDLNGLLNVDYGRDHYILSTRFHSVSDTLSVTFTNLHFAALKEYYTNKAIERQEQALGIVEEKRDSIATALSLTERLIAQNQDQTIGSFSNRTNAQLSELNTRSVILKTALAKAEENLAIAQFAKQTNTPLIQLIDAPLLPVEKLSPSIFRILLWGFAGGFLIFFLALSLFFLWSLKV